MKLENAPDKVAVDMSSFMWRALKAKVDHENGFEVMFNGKKLIVNSAAYGYENVTNMLVGLLEELAMTPKDMILVFEGKNSKSKRILIDNTYKGGGAASHAVEEYIEFNKLKEMLQQVWRGLGAMQLTQDYAEGDDTLGWLKREYPGTLIVATYDGDLTVLNSEDGETNEYGGTCKVWVGGKIGLNKYGAFDFRYVRMYKALCGDSSDGIRGVEQFGPAAFEKLVNHAGWDGIDQLAELLDTGKLEELYGLAEEDSKLGKLVKLIVASEASVVKAWQLVKVYPEWVNTFKSPLHWLPGKVEPLPEDADKRLAQWYGQSWLITADEYQDALESLRAELPKSVKVGFDIETSTPDESDDWLAAQGNADGVDQIGSVLTGFSLTYGDNYQYTIYVSVDHAQTNNITMVQARELLELVFSYKRPLLIQSTFFELSVLYMAEDEDGTLWRDHWEDNGYHGFLPNVLDTKLEGSYTDENIRQGLKLRSLTHLGYEQASYDATTKLSGPVGTLFPGGRVLREWEVVLDEPETFLDAGGVERESDAPTERWEERRYKMRELPATAVFDYGADDTICTAALHNFYELFMHLEHTWVPYLETELSAAYLHAKSFVDGMTFSVEKSKELERIDDLTYDKAWGTVREYLIDKGWNGTKPPVFTEAITVPEIKFAWAIVTGQLETDEEDDEDEGAEDEEAGSREPEPVKAPKDFVLGHRGRTPKKLLALIQAEGESAAVFASKLERCMAGDAAGFTKWVNSYFKGDPIFKISNKQMVHLLYEVMGCSIQIRGKATVKMRAKGIYLGNPKGDALALAYALREKAADPVICGVLNGLKLMQMVKTRRGLYYSKYPNFVHWKTGKIHGTHNQCATNTKRASEAKPNKQQLPKHPKIEGEPARFREAVVPHCPDAVIVSADFDSQELRIIADYSRDQNMVDCFVGENKKSMHSLTGQDILIRRKLSTMSYEEFEAIAKQEDHPDYKLVKEYRALGKKTNFTTEFGAMAEKLAQTLLCSVAEAQIFIDAKESKFPDVVAWKDGVIKEAKKVGYVYTLNGDKRHLREALVNGDHYAKSKAERQSVNTKVQGSAAGMTKRAEGRMWEDDLAFDFDAKYIGPVHDECVWSVLITDLPKFLPRLHKAMVAPFGGMTIPIESALSFGPSFGSQVELGTVPSMEAILSGLERMDKKYGTKSLCLLSEKTTDA